MSQITPEILQALRNLYEPSVIPPCRICGQALSIGKCGGGEPTEWYCSGQEEDPDNPGYLRWKPGRDFTDKHFSESVRGKIFGGIPQKNKRRPGRNQGGGKMLRIVGLVFDWTFYTLACATGLVGCLAHDPETVLWGCFLLLVYIAGKMK